MIKKEFGEGLTGIMGSVWKNGGPTLQFLAEAVSTLASPRSSTIQSCRHPPLLTIHLAECTGQRGDAQGGTQFLDSRDSAHLVAYTDWGELCRHRCRRHCIVVQRAEPRRYCMMMLSSCAARNRHLRSASTARVRWPHTMATSNTEEQS